MVIPGWMGDRHDAHFMAIERSDDPKTHEVRYSLKRVLPGGETSPGDSLGTIHTRENAYGEEKSTGTTVFSSLGLRGGGSGSPIISICKLYCYGPGLQKPPPSTTLFQ